MLWNVTNDTTDRMSGGVPGSPAAVLLQAVTTGAHYGAQYQEIYESDLKNPDLSSVLDTANALLTTTPPPPAAPDDANATSSSSAAIALTWNDNADNELGNRVESKIGLTGTYELLSTFGANVAGVTVTRLSDGTSYYFRVAAVNAAGLSAYSNETSAATILTSPSALTAQAVSSSQILLTWSDRSATETGFTIERSPITDTDYTPIATVSANTTSFTDTDLGERTKYWYRVRAYNAYATSSYSGAKQATTLNELPPAPSGLKTTSVMSNKVNLSWIDNSGNESGFRVQRKTGATGTYADIKTTAANTTSYTNNDSSLKDGTLYYYRVCAMNSAGDSPFSDELPATTILNSPNSLTTQALSSSQVVLTWSDRSATETAFTIERSLVTNTDYVPIATVGANTASFTDVGLSEATKYWYRVRASNGDATSAYSNAKSVTTLRGLPAAPSSLAITSLLTDKVSLSWIDGSGNESGFRIQRKTGATGTYTDIKTTAANITSYTDKDGALKDGTLYYYRVSATNSAGDSAFSNDIGGATPLTTPTSVALTAMSSDRIDISWADNSGSETGYKIERKTKAAGTYAQIAQVSANVQSYSDTTGLDPQTRYYYRVRATNGTIDSAYSNEPFAVTFP